MKTRAYKVWAVFLVAGALALEGGAATPPWKGRRESQGAPSQSNGRLQECLASQVWMAHLKDKKGNPLLIRDTFGTEDDRHWLGLDFTEFDGPRIRLGVLRVVNKTPRAEANGGRGDVAVEVAGIEEMLTTALYRTNRFDIVERKRIDEVLGEQARSAEYQPSPKAIFNVGKVLGVQYLVYGTVNEWTPERSTKAMKGGILPFRGGAGKSEAEVMMTFSVTDVSNGQVLFTTQERAKIGEWAFSVEAGTGDGEGDGGVTQVTPVGYAVQACLNKAAFSVAMWLRSRKWKGSVIDIKKDEIYINAGSNHGIRSGMQLTALSNRGLVVDPEQKNMILGEDTRSIGTLEITVAQPGYAIARVMAGCKGLKKTDRVELADPPQPHPLEELCNLQNGVPRL